MEKIRVVKPKSDGLPSDLVITDDSITLITEGQLAVLDRHSLEKRVSARIGDYAPCWWHGDLLVLASMGKVSVWDRQRRRMVWKTKTWPTILPWRNYALTISEQDPQDRKLEVRQVETGEVVRTTPLGAHEVNSETLCGNDLLILDTMRGGDPVRMINLAEGRLVWERNLTQEMRSIIGEDKPYGWALGVVAGSRPGSFVVTCGRNIFGCSLEDGHILWRVDAYVPYAWPIVEGGLIPVLARQSAFADRFMVIDEATGKVRSDRTYAELANVTHPRPGCIWGDKVVFVADSGHIATFSLADGALVSLLHYKTSFRRAVILDDRLLAAADDGNIWVFAQGDAAAKAPARSKASAASRKPARAH